jgi:1,2-diacylglycerol 3-beta-glucosyltransferase
LRSFCLSVLAFFARPSQHIPASKSERRFAVLIPAHDEEKVIRATLTSVLEVDYPRDRWEVVVIADNCTDTTADIGRELGVNVWERQDRIHRGKGHALRWCIDKLMREDPSIDAFVIIDADSTPSKNLLRVMNYYLDQGWLALQSNYIVEPRKGTWVSDSIRVGFALQNYVRPLGRWKVGAPVGAKGNGMCFSRKTFEQVPWEAYSQIEDLEYSLVLLERGIKMGFVPQATIMTVMPTDPALAESQRARWEMGRYPLIRSFFKRLFVASFRQRSLSLLDMWVDLITPAFVNLVGISVVMALVSAVLGALGVVSHAYTVAWIVLVAFGLGHVLLGLSAYGDPTIFKAALSIPRYVLWKVAVYARLVRKGHTKEWVRTARES